MNKSGDQTKALFSSPRGIKGISCFGRCKEEQTCSTRCFAEFGSDDFYTWLICPVEENKCVKLVPKGDDAKIDNSAEDVGYASSLRRFDPKSLEESDGKGNIPEFKLVACKGHALQGNYEGSFVYARTPILLEKAIPAVRAAATNAGLNWEEYNRIDNTCPPGQALNDASAGTGTSTKEWIDLVVGPAGGGIDWISPDWRGEYKK